VKAAGSWGARRPSAGHVAPAALLDRFEAASGRREELPGGWFRPIHRRTWDGFGVIRAHGEPGELPEGQLSSHAVIVNTGGPGTLEIRLPGEGWRALRYAPLAVSVIPAGMPYAVRRRDAAECIVVGIAPSLVDAIAGPARGRLELLPSIMAADPVLAHAAIALAEEAAAGACGARLAAESLGTALVAHLLAHHGALRRPPRHGASLSRPGLERVLAHVAENLAGDLSLRELAGVAQLDVFAFVRAFRESTGLPPHRYVLRARVERAKALLRESVLSISEVALRVGFATPSHFATTFRRATSLTPRSFRRSAG
jgi:AraC family transcriptional regulator